MAFVIIFLWGQEVKYTHFLKSKGDAKTASDTSRTTSVGPIYLKLLF